MAGDTKPINHLEKMFVDPEGTEPINHLEKIIKENIGGGGGGGAGVLLGTVDQTSTAFPTTRPDGTALVAGDYVKVSSSATLPFTLSGITFTTTRDKASWNGTAWVLDAGEFQTTAQTPVSNKANESYTGTAETQAGINTEVANFIKGLDPDTQIMIETVGDSGTVSDEEIEQITDQTKNVILINDDEIYRLFEVGTNFFTFTNVNTESTTKVSYKSIYVNTSEEAVNYKSWTKEESVPEVTAEVLDSLIDGAGDIIVDLNEDEDTLIIGTHAKIVTISDVPPTAEQGTLTEEQLAALQESTKSVIVFNNEIYMLNDNGHETGTLGYSHSGVENGVFMLKNITVTVNTRGWVLTNTEIPELLGSTGQSTTAGMTQKAITDALANAGGVKELTAADYNYPENNPTSVALWLLEPNTYVSNSGVDVYISSSARVTNGGMFIVGKSNSDNNIPVIVSESGSSASDNLIQALLLNKTTGGASKWDIALKRADVINSLTDTSTNKPLSANQGKVLKDQIGSLTDLDTTDKTNLVNAINEIAAGGGGGGELAHKLTTADYNYPASSPNSIALWLLEPGVYWRDTNDSLSIKWNNGTEFEVNTNLFVTYIVGGKNGVYRTIITLSSGGNNINRAGWIYNVNPSNGNIFDYQRLLSNNSIDDNLTSTGNQTALAARQGKVLKDLIDSLEERVRALEGNA